MPLSLRDEIKKKQELKHEEENKQPTFQPVLIASKRKNVLILGSRFDSLYQDSMKRKESSSAQPMSTFKPRISPRARSKSRERKSADLIDSLHNALGSGRVTVKDAPTNTFTPTVNKRAGSTSQSSPSDTSKRLYDDRERHQEHRSKEMEDKDRKLAEQCTFSPRVNKSRESVDSTKITSVTDRLLLSGEKTKKKLEEKMKLKATREISDSPFQPTLIAISRPSNSDVANDDVNVYERLANPVPKDYSSLMAAVNAEFTFQPKLFNGTSHLTEGETKGLPVHERLFNESIVKRKEIDEEVKYLIEN